MTDWKSIDSGNAAVDQFILGKLPASFGTLYTEAGDHFGTDMFRKVDQRLQSLRKRGLIKFFRNGGKIIWDRAPPPTTKPEV